MIGYVTLGTRNFAKATPFYDELMKEFGATRQIESPDRLILWGTAKFANAWPDQAL